MAQIKSSLRGHKNILQFWTRFLDPNQNFKKDSGVFLFVGPPGIGKSKTAWAMIQQSLCESLQMSRQFNEVEACGFCGSCLRVEKEAHESVLFISSERDLLKLEVARDILDFLSLQSLSARRFVVLDGAQNLNTQASNALLKILEEPPLGTFFFLLLPNRMSLMPTLRSRSITLRFFPLEDQDLNAGMNLPPWIVKASRGSLGRVKDLGTAESQEFRASSAQLLLKLFQSQKIFMESDWRNSVKDKDFLSRTWDFWLELVRDAYCLKAQREDLMTAPDQRSVSVTLSEQTDSFLESILEMIFKQKSEQNTPKDAVLLIESLSVQVGQELHSGGLA